MYIYSASMQALPGKARAVGEVMSQLRDTAKKATRKDAWAWRSVGAGPSGAYGLSARVENTAELLEVQQLLADSPEFQKEGDALAPLLSGPAEISVNRIVASTATGEPKQFVTVTTATMAGQMSSAMTWSNGVLEAVTKATGLGGVLTLPASGNIFQLGWIFGSDSPDEMDERAEKLATNEEYIYLIDQADGLIVPGSVTRWLLAQLP